MYLFVIRLVQHHLIVSTGPPRFFGGEIEEKKKQIAGMNVPVCNSTRDTASHSRRAKQGGGGGKEKKMHAVSYECTCS